MATCFAVMVRRPIRRTGRSSDVDRAHSQYLHAMERHARGIGEKAEKRRIEGAGFRCRAVAAGPDGKPLGWKNVTWGESAPQVGLREAWRNHMKAHGAKLRANARMGEHFILGVTPEWLEAEGGSRHDVKNPRVQKLVRLAVRWVRAEFGGVFAARYDCDERGAIVDVFAAPIRKQGRKGAERNYVAVTQAHREAAKRGGQYHSFAAMHDSWHRACIRHLDPSIQRGRPVGEGGRTHEDTDVFKRRMDGITEAAAAEVERKRLEHDAVAEATEKKRIEAARLLDEAQSLQAQIAALRSERRKLLKAKEIDRRRGQLTSRAIRTADSWIKTLGDAPDIETFQDVLGWVADSSATMRGDAEAEARLERRFGATAAEARQQRRGR